MLFFWNAKKRMTQIFQPTKFERRRQISNLIFFLTNLSNVILLSSHVPSESIIIDLGPPIFFEIIFPLKKSHFGFRTLLECCQNKIWIPTLKKTQFSYILKSFSQTLYRNTDVPTFGQNIWFFKNGDRCDTQKRGKHKILFLNVARHSKHSAPRCSPLP